MAITNYREKNLSLEPDPQYAIKTTLLPALWRLFRFLLLLHLLFSFLLWLLTHDLAPVNIANKGVFM